MSEQTAEKPAETPTKRPLTQEQMIEAFSGPATYSNRMVLNSSPPGIRLTFMEQHPQVTAQFRAAIFLSWQDAISLRDLLDRNIKPIEEQIKAELQKAKEAQPSET